jgi:hypothetical protein
VRRTRPRQGAAERQAEEHGERGADQGAAPAGEVRVRRGRRAEQREPRHEDSKARGQVQGFLVGIVGVEGSNSFAAERAGSYKG